jgi:hypothetical protein
MTAPDEFGWLQSYPFHLRVYPPNDPSLPGSDPQFPIFDKIRLNLRARVMTVAPKTVKTIVSKAKNYIGAIVPIKYFLPQYPLFSVPFVFMYETR